MSDAAKVTDIRSQIQCKRESFDCGLLGCDPIQLPAASPEDGSSRFRSLQMARIIRIQCTSVCQTIQEQDNNHLIK
jgi:hypothetical protein